MNEHVKRNLSFKYKCVYKFCVLKITLLKLERILNLHFVLTLSLSKPYRSYYYILHHT